MSRARRSEPCTIAGPAGALEALLDRPVDDAAPSAVALVCHPHPQYQGTMHNKVAHTLARAATELGALSLRFNFRGVGRSEGSYAQGRGELDDALAAAEWLHAREPQAPLWLMGFSFGAGIALAAAARLEPAVLVTVAPPIRSKSGTLLPFSSPGESRGEGVSQSRQPANTVSDLGPPLPPGEGRGEGVSQSRQLPAHPPRFEHPHCPWLLLQGDDDDVVEAGAVVEWARTLTPPPEIVTFPETGHFFHGKLNVLRGTLVEKLPQLLGAT